MTQIVLDDSVLVVQARGELDIATTPGFRRGLEEAIDEGHRRIVVDLSGVSFIDSVGLAALVNVRRRLTAEGRLAVVTDPESYATLIIEVAGVDVLLDVVSTREEAVARVRGTAPDR